MSFFSKKKQEIDPADNDFSKISNEIKNSPEKLSEAQKLFKNNESLRKRATGLDSQQDKSK
ncbi:hypothetical protein [Companilactobacillus mishanensis]|uniref:Uncharacterized protein n=1 Tax=Companilactobacillus mishanensis TaxID=2486008 RepID=A0A5P0ZEZ2_9LACO|nr:hypothetical protein [Companilactobacillus mishanensis]MQS44339.1 hypothetical protein [Companilactobacillus mishanensis]MQS51559.1 hypothetical protein [Companilactobacillus mishanensis]MQS88579.1 hypothetical protein [Companilactobacillus mishanensis]